MLDLAEATCVDAPLVTADGFMLQDPYFDLRGGSFGPVNWLARPSNYSIETFVHKKDGGYL